MKSISAILRVLCSLNKVRKQRKWVIPRDQNKICCVGRKAGGCDVGRWRNNTVRRRDAEDTQNQKLWARVPTQRDFSTPVDQSFILWFSELPKEAHPSSHPYFIYRHRRKYSKLRCTLNNPGMSTLSRSQGISVWKVWAGGGQKKSKWIYREWPRRPRAGQDWGLRLGLHGPVGMSLYFIWFQ